MNSAAFLAPFQRALSHQRFMIMMVLSGFVILAHMEGIDKGFIKKLYCKDTNNKFYAWIAGHYESAEGILILVTACCGISGESYLWGSIVAAFLGTISGPYSTQVYLALGALIIVLFNSRDVRVRLGVIGITAFAYYSKYLVLTVGTHKALSACTNSTG